MRALFATLVLAFTPAFAGAVDEKKEREAVAADHADDEPRPFDQTRDAMADIDAALGRARAAGRRVLLVLGGNWCHDSRSFAMKLLEPSLAARVAESFEVVFVDVGRRDRNLDTAKRFGVHSLIGTPTILVLSASGELLNRESVSDWRNAADRTVEDLGLYLDGFAAGEAGR